MATAKKIVYNDNTPIIVDYAANDGQGNNIVDTYAKINDIPITATPLKDGWSGGQYVPSITTQSGLDLNTLTTAGMYRLQDGITNAAPAEGHWGQLLVIHGGGDTVGQLYWSYPSGFLFYRQGATSSGVWSEWKEVADKTWVKQNPKYTISLSGSTLTITTNY